MKTTEEPPVGYFYKTTKTPVGRLKLVAGDRGLVAILWENDDPKRVPLAPLTKDGSHPVLLETERQLGDYFAGKRKRFDLEFDFIGTDFQKEVWAALTTIPFGETRSYAQIAQQIGRPKAVRAVGAANGKNPVSIVVPCHRVIGSNGGLTGFAGGLDTKALLLEIESGARRSNGNGAIEPEKTSHHFVRKIGSKSDARRLAPSRVRWLPSQKRALSSFTTP